MANTEKTTSIELISYLLSLKQSDDRGALAVLRRGLSSPPAQDIAMYPYIARFVSEKARYGRAEKVAYLIAALFAYHQLNTSEGNFGDHMRSLIRDQDQKSTERRFVRLLSVEFEDLADFLRQPVSMLKSQEISIHWEQLYKDLLQWDRPDKRVQKRWANSFWRAQTPDDNKADLEFPDLEETQSNYEDEENEGE